MLLDHARVGERVHGPAPHGLAHGDVQKNQDHKADRNRLVRPSRDVCIIRPQPMVMGLHFTLIYLDHAPNLESAFIGRP